jgi:Rrf2 family protein
MKLSTKGRYGVLAVYEVALKYNVAPVSIREIAINQNFSESYLEQLFASLKKEGILSSIRGPKGGYILSRKPEDITVGEVIKILEGPIEIAGCVTTDNINIDCEKSEQCITRGIWLKVSESINNVINNITFQDLLDGNI